MLADALIENRLPRHELKADAVIDHGEAAARELGRADKPAADILAGLGGGESQSTFDGHTVASDYGGAWVETAYREILSPETRCLTQSERVDPSLQLRQVLGAGVRSPRKRVGAILAPHQIDSMTGVTRIRLTGSRMLLSPWAQTWLTNR